VGIGRPDEKQTGYRGGCKHIAPYWLTTFMPQASDIKRLRELEHKNRHLKQISADFVAGESGVVDEFNREALAIEVDFNLPAPRIVRTLDGIAG
jgi:hypothetical protein